MSLILPAGADAIENQDVVSLIGYEFNTVKTGKLEIDYRLGLTYDEYKISNNAWITESQKEYGISNALFLSYDVVCPLSLNVLAPFVYKYSDMGTEKSKDFADIGDVSIGAKVQLHNSKHMTINLNVNYVAPTGRSPYEINPDHDLATGNGYNSVQSELSVCTWFHRVYPFLSLQYYKNFSIQDLNQNRYGSTLKEVDPGDVFGTELGVGVDVSEKISLLFGLNYRYHASEEKVFLSGTREVMDDASVGLSAGFGWKFSKISAINVTIAEKFYSDPDEIQGFPDYQIHLRIPVIF
jgi:hypothetical protein